MAVATALAATYTPQLQLQQAQRAAERAEQNAVVLREKAQDAQRTADHEQENARSLQVRSDQAQQLAGSARQGLLAAKSLSNVQNGIEGIRQQISQVGAQATSGGEANNAVTTTPVVNAAGQTTGTLVNTTA